jgi:hypothetical protein
VAGAGDAVASSRESGATEAQSSPRAPDHAQSPVRLPARRRYSILPARRVEPVEISALLHVAQQCVKPTLAIQLLVTLPGGLRWASWEGVLRQGGVKPILELGALAHEHHPRPRQLALVTQRARRNPHRG